MPDLDLVSRVLHRDRLVIVIDKPAGLPVHAGPKGGPNLEAAFDQLRFDLPGPPALAHRLDRDTSGCLALGRHRKALARLGRLFAGGQVRKTYWALVVGVPPEEAGRIDLPLAKRSTEARGWWMTVDPAGRAASTLYRRRGAGAGMSWLELQPLTGRTHQLRVHLAALGCAVVGDPIYGERDQKGVPLQLHSRTLVLPLYGHQPAIEAVAPVPPHMRANLEACGFDPAVEEGPSGAAPPDQGAS